MYTSILELVEPVLSYDRGLGYGDGLVLEQRQHYVGTKRSVAMAMQTGNIYPLRLKSQHKSTPIPVDNNTVQDT